jgi:hypothetical protein
VVVLRAGITEAESTVSWAGTSALLDGLDGVGLDELTGPQRRLLDRARGRTSDGPVDRASATYIVSRCRPSRGED